MPVKQTKSSVAPRLGILPRIGDGRLAYRLKSDDFTAEQIAPSAHRRLRAPGTQATCPRSPCGSSDAEGCFALGGQTRSAVGVADVEFSSGRQSMLATLDFDDVVQSRRYVSHRGSLNCSQSAAKVTSHGADRLHAF